MFVLSFCSSLTTKPVGFAQVLKVLQARGIVERSVDTHNSDDENADILCPFSLKTVGKIRQDRRNIRNASNRINNHSDDDLSD